MMKADILVELKCDHNTAVGWSLGCIVGGSSISGWYPPSFVRPFDYDVIRGGHRPLIPIRMPRCRHRWDGLPVCRASSVCPVGVHASHRPSPLFNASSNGVEPLAAGLSAPPNIALDETLVSLVSGGPAASILHRTKTETAYIATTCVTG